MPAQPGKKPTRVRIFDAAASNQRTAYRTMPVIRGILPEVDFAALVIPDYQRKALENAKHRELREALDPVEGSGIPDDLLLCVRSTRFNAVGAGQIVVPLPASGLVVLDGHQRVFAAEARVRAKEAIHPFGVKLLLGTTQEEESEIFYQVNGLQTPVVTQVFIRNRKDNTAVRDLRAMTEADPDFPTVQWDQDRPKVRPYITARMLYQTALVLHGYPQSEKFRDLIRNLNSLTDEIGTALLVANVQEFFKVIRKCFDKDGRREYTYLAGSLNGLARFFSEYQDFWGAKNEPGKLVVRKDNIEKILSFDIGRLEAASTAKSPGRALFFGLEAHFNSIKKGKSLTPRPKRQRITP